MKRALFMSELQRAVILQAAFAAMIALIVGVGVYYQARPQDVIFPLALFLLAGAVTGGAMFANGFQQKQWPLLLTLPIHRSTVWCLIVGAHASASLIGIVGIFVTLSYAGPNGSATLIPLITIYLLFFCAGTITIFLSPGGRRISWESLFAVLLGVVPGFLQLFALFHIAYVSFKLGSPPREPLTHPDRSLWFAAERGDLRFAMVAFGLVMIGLLLLSRSAFIRGETQLAPVQHKYQALCFGFLVSLGLVAPVLGEGFARLDSWVLNQATASSDGQYLAILERGSRHPAYERISVFDLHSGAKLSSTERKGVLSVVWSPAKPTLNVLIERRSLAAPILPFLRTRDQFVVFSPQLAELGQLTHSEITEAVPLANDKVLVITREATGSVVMWDPQTGAAQALAGGPFDGTVHIQRSSDKVLVDFTNFTTPSSVWSMDGEARAFEWHGSTLDARPRYIIDGIVYTDQKTAREALVRYVSPPAGPARAQAFLVSAAENLISNQPSGQVTYVTASTHVFRLQSNSDNETATLSAFNPDLKRWKDIEPAIELNEDDKRAVEFASQRLVWTGGIPGIAVDSEKGIAAYIGRSEGRSYVRLYDAAIDRTIDVATLSENVPGGHVTFHRATGLKGLLMSAPVGTFTYIPGSGNITPIKLGAEPGGDLIYLDSSGTQVYRDSAGKIFRQMGSGAKTLVWPQ